VSLDLLKGTYLAYYISALRGCCAINLLYTLEIDQALLVHTPIGISPPKKFLS